MKKKIIITIVSVAICSSLVVPLKILAEKNHIFDANGKDITATYNQTQNELEKEKNSEKERIEKENNIKNDKENIKMYSLKNDKDAILNEDPKDTLEDKEIQQADENDMRALYIINRLYKKSYNSIPDVREEDNLIMDQMIKGIEENKYSSQEYLIIKNYLIRRCGWMNNSDPYVYKIKKAINK